VAFHGGDPTCRGGRRPGLVHRVDVPVPPGSGPDSPARTQRAPPSASDRNASSMTCQTFAGLAGGSTVISSPRRLLPGALQPPVLSAPRQGCTEPLRPHTTRSASFRRFGARRLSRCGTQTGRPADRAMLPPGPAAVSPAGAVTPIYPHGGCAPGPPAPGWDETGELPPRRSLPSWPMVSRRSPRAGHRRLGGSGVNGRRCNRCSRPRGLTWCGVSQVS